MEFRVLGPLEVVRDGEPVDLGPRKQRETLSLLLLHAGRVVPTERLLEGIWGDEAHAKENALWVTLSRLRSVLDPGRQANGDAVLVTKDHGYLLDVRPEQLDATHFEHLAQEGRHRLPTDPSGAATAFQEALDLWRGDAWADVRFLDFAHTEITRLDELRLAAMEDLLRARLESGDAEGVSADAAALVAEHPLRERPVRLLMLGLYQTGRQAEALRAYSSLAERLGSELGIEPSPELQRLEEQVLLHDWNVRPRRTATNTNPFKGLEPFREDDAVDFHGRDRIVSDLVRRIGDGATLLTLVGASGSGKSSIVRAGVIPALRKGALPGSDGWLVATMVPGSHPFAELEAALLRSSLDAPASLGDQLSVEGSGILRAALRVMPDEQSRLVLVIDQFEELFTLTSDPAVRDRFLEGLLTAAADPKGRITILLTLRADFYDRPLQHAAFANRFGDGVVNVAPLLPDELEDAANRPAQRAGATIEPALVGTLVSDVLGRPGSLPFFQFVLTDLFEAGEGHLALDDYRALGGLGGALSKRAEEAYARLDADEQAACRQLFLRMVAVAEGAEWSRRRLHADELRSLGFDGETLQVVIGTLIEARLLTTDRDPTSGRPTVEVAHESLLTVWERLARWIEEAEDDLRRHAVLAAAVRDWLDADEDPDFLWARGRLEAYRTWAETATIDLSNDEQRFLGESVQTEEERTQQVVTTERKARRRAWGLVAAVVGMLAVAVWAFWPLLNPPADVLLIRIAGEHAIQGQFESGLSQAEEDFGVSTRAIHLAADPHAQIDAALADEPDLVILGIDVQTAAYDWAAASEAYPNMQFVVLQELFDHPRTDQWTTVSWNDHEGAYLAGVAAARHTRTGIVGYVGAHPGMVAGFLPGFELGAKDTDPDVSVASAYTPVEHAYEVWRDLEGAGATGRAVLAAGADVIFPAHGGAAYAVLYEAAAASDETGEPVWGIGVDADTALLLAPTDDHVAGHILTSMVKRFDIAVHRSIERFLAGDTSSFTMSVASGAYDLATTGGHLTDSDLEAVEAAKRRIASGDVVVPAFSDHGATVEYPVDVEAGLRTSACETGLVEVVADDHLRVEITNDTEHSAFVAIGRTIPGWTPTMDYDDQPNPFVEPASSFAIVPPGGTGTLVVVAAEPGPWATGCLLGDGERVLAATAAAFAVVPAG